MSTIKIYNAADIFEVDRVKEVLKEHNIECYVSEAGVGGYLTIQQGFSTFGKDIYVHKEDEDKAKKLIEELKEEFENEIDDYSALAEEAYSAMENEDENDRELDDMNLDKMDRVSWFMNRTIVARIILIFAIIMGIVTLLVNYVQR